MSTIDSYTKNNAGYAQHFAAAGLASAPAGRVAVLACMDARLEIGAALGLREGDAHVIRNAGGVVTDDVIRSLMISQRLLATREVMIVQHTDCGMVKFTESELKDAVERDTGTRPPFPLHAFTDLEENVRRSIRKLQESPFLLHRDAVRGFVYDVGTGRLREVK